MARAKTRRVGVTQRRIAAGGAGGARAHPEAERERQPRRLVRPPASAAQRDASAASCVSACAAEPALRARTRGARACQRALLRRCCTALAARPAGGERRTHHTAKRSTHHERSARPSRSSGPGTACAVGTILRPGGSMGAAVVWSSALKVPITRDTHAPSSAARVYTTFAERRRAPVRLLRAAAAAAAAALQSGRSSKRCAGATIVSPRGSQPRQRSPHFSSPALRCKDACSWRQQHQHRQ